MRHQQYVVNTVEVETIQTQPDASEVSELTQEVKHLQENDNANESQFQEVDEMRHGSCSTATCMWLLSRQGRAAKREMITT